MAEKMSLKEIISFEEMLVEEDLASMLGMKGDKPAEGLGQGVYFLLDDSYVMLLGGKAGKNPR